MTEARLLQEIERDRPVHLESGGGVTFSGGEPLLQADFLLRLLEGCRDLGIHSAVDTCGAAAPHVVERVADRADLVLYDVKHLDDERHRRVTGASNREILDNLRLLAQTRAAVRVRFPLVSGFNDDAGHVRRLAGFLASLGLRQVDVLPYRGVPAGAYEALGRTNMSSGVREPHPDAVSEVCGLLAEHGLHASVVERRLIHR
jgi:pyruvate formate lyase activating enzyme